MKKAFVIILAMISLAACKKEKAAPTTNVIGKWELHRRFGGNIVPPDTTYQAGNGNLLQFNPDSTYKTYYEGTVIDAGSFHIVKGGYRIDGRAYDELYFINTDFAATPPDMVTQSGGTLTLKPIMPDAGSMQYNKIPN